MPLTINSNMICQFQTDSSASSASQFHFFLSSPKILSFFRRPPNLSQKNEDLGLIHHWIAVKFGHHVRNPIPRILTVGNVDIVPELREIPLTL